MPTLVQLCRNAYRVLFLCYPSDLRRRFDMEIADVFAEQLCGEWQRRGLRGFARVWSTALWELLTVAAPLRLQSPSFIAFAVSLLGAAAFCAAFLRAVSTR
jgi:hypothetical protein